MKKLKDTDLREALRRNYAETPQLPEGFMERMHEAVEQEESQPRRTRSYRLVAAITSIAAAVLIAFLLWPESHEMPIMQPEQQPVVVQHSEKQDTLVMQIEKEHAPMIAQETSVQVQAVTSKQTDKVQAYREMEEDIKVDCTDSFDYYLAHLEAEMDALDDSVSSAQLEKLISADARLRQLVNRIVGSEVEQALNAARPDSTRDYLNF